MRYIKTIDDITKDGSVDFGAGYEFVEDAKDADAILMRSTDLHGYELPEGIRAIGRCGAGVNNIPVEEYARRGVVVFNSPGANSKRRQGNRHCHDDHVESRHRAGHAVGA